MNIEHRDESTHIGLQDTAHIEGFGLLENSAEPGLCSPSRFEKSICLLQSLILFSRWGRFFLLVAVMSCSYLAPHIHIIERRDEIFLVASDSKYSRYK